MADTVINIDIGNITGSSKKLEKYAKLLEKAIEDSMIDFSRMYKKKLFENMTAYGVPASIVGQITTVPDDNGITIFINSEIVDFFEYGTGVRGASNPHPKVPAGWKYDVNGHGQNGWWYPTTTADPNPYKWVDGSGQLRAWTRGKISRPFIYATNKWARQSITNVVRKHIRRIKID